MEVLCSQRVFINKHIYYTYFFISVLLKKYIYGFLLREKTLSIYIFSNYIYHILTFLKYNAISNVNSLLDIAVVDNISFAKDSKRFVLNYVF